MMHEMKFRKRKHFGKQHTVSPVSNLLYFYPGDKIKRYNFMKPIVHNVLSGK